MHRPLAILALVALALGGCTKAPSDATPSGAVRLFLAALQRSERDPGALEDAYRLLSSPSRRALTERAHLAGSLGARDLEPWEMIVAGRSRATFAPARGARGMRESIQGERATVTVQSQDGERTAEVALVRERGRWRIVMELPPPRARVNEEAPPLAETPVR